ncbi:hypothetical protein R69746_07588 [Paraburkholderia aspalathi]|nr:hypothetical protein R69746_07588 [Paraburkholderia aspalathi]CAE6869669.1 hypothetical protein R75465_08195 [Paraburkholderia aspalathi]
MRIVSRILRIGALVDVGLHNFVTNPRPVGTGSRTQATIIGRAALGGAAIVAGLLSFPCCGSEAPGALKVHRIPMQGDRHVTNLSGP